MNKIRHVAELAVIFSINIKNKKHSRLNNLQNKLKKVVEKRYIAESKKLSDEDFEIIVAKVKKWRKTTGWYNNTKSLGTLLSFCALMIDESPLKYDPKINEIITDIIDHMTEGNKFYMASLPASELAFKKWINEFGKENYYAIT